MLLRALHRFFNRYRVDLPKPPVSGWRGRAKRASRFLNYGMLTFVTLGIAVMPFLIWEAFYFAQLALMLVFTVSLKLDYGLGRFGEAIEKHGGWRKAVDHLVLLTMIGLMGVMGQTAPTPFFGWTWTALGVVFTLLYLLKVSGWKPPWLRARYEAAQKQPDNV